MPLRNRLIPALAMLLLAAPAAADLPPPPPDYPSHRDAGVCNQQQLRQELSAYNHERLRLAEVLRHLATVEPLQPATHERLLGYAAHLDEMRQKLPDPDPDSNAFRNFDFQLGMTLTAIALFLNSADDQLAALFTAERDDPASHLGRYLAELEVSRATYMDHLDSARSTDCRS